MKGADSFEGEDSNPRLNMGKYFVYILNCSNGSLYTGYTADLDKRFEKHLAGKTGAKFTRSFKPTAIAAAWKIHGTRGDAMRVESFIKRLDRHIKEHIASDPAYLQVLLADKYDVIVAQVKEEPPIS